MSHMQYATVLALVALAVAGGISLLGNHANTKLNQTASDVGNPSALTQRFGASSSTPSQGGTNPSQNGNSGS
jgi:hypothetical protein